MLNSFISKHKEDGNEQHMGKDKRRQLKMEATTSDCKTVDWNLTTKGCSDYPWKTCSDLLFISLWKRIFFFSFFFPDKENRNLQFSFLKWAVNHAFGILYNMAIWVRALSANIALLCGRPSLDHPNWVHSTYGLIVSKTNEANWLWYIFIKTMNCFDQGPQPSTSLETESSTAFCFSFPSGQSSPNTMCHCSGVLIYSVVAYLFALNQILQKSWGNFYKQLRA